MNKITYEERAEVYARAREKWGAEKQYIVAIEEMSEVIKALTKWLRCDTCDESATVIPSIIEEVADATIMLEQIRLFLGINDKVCKAMDAKIQRLARKIDGPYGCHNCANQHTPKCENCCSNKCKAFAIPSEWMRKE